MSMPSLVELAEVGTHFGHHRSLTFPKSKNFIFTVKNNVSIINLEETQRSLAEAQQVFHRFKDAGKPILFVGTRRSVRSITREVAESVGCSYVTERWFGGMLTNFSTMLENIKQMNKDVEYLDGDKSKSLSKKERLMLENKLARSRRFRSGVADLKEVPALLIIASASEDKIAIREANQVGVPVISITDTDINPEMITYPIPANDDSPRAVELILRTIVSSPTKSSTPKAKTAEKKEEEAVEQPTKEEVEKPAKKSAAKKTTTKKTTKSKTKEA